MKETTYPYFEDILIETKTHRADWCVGIRAINAALGHRVLSQKITPEFLRKQEITAYYVASTFPGKVDYMLIALWPDLHRYIKAHTPTLVVDDNNGAKPIILKETTPLIGREEARLLTLGMSELKKSLDNTIKALHELTEKL